VRVRGWRGPLLCARRGKHGQYVGGKREEGGSYRSEDATEDEAQAVDVSVLVRVVFH